VQKGKLNKEARKEEGNDIKAFEVQSTNVKKRSKGNI
jgi:hypothetical protein